MNELFSGKTVERVQKFEDPTNQQDEITFFFTDGTQATLYSGGSVDSFGNVISWISEY